LNPFKPFGLVDRLMKAGLWHDLGKFMEAFQRYMLEDEQRIEHAVVGDQTR